MTVRAFIIDDETPAREELRFLLEQTGEVAVVGEAASGSAALRGIREASPDLVFLDIQMPGISGLELSRILTELPTHPLVVFATAFDQYACEAFEVEAVDYLLKPFTLARVRKAVARAARLLGREPAGGKGATGERRESAEVRKIPLFLGERIIPTAPERIVFARAEEGEGFVQTPDGRYKSRSTLTELEHKLSRHGFVRVHRSFLVNANRVREAIPWCHGSFKLVMDDRERTEIMVSRYHARELKRHFDL